MSIVSLTGNDTAVIQGIVLRDVADGDWLTLSYPNTLAELTVGKGGNAIYALNAMGLIADVTIRVIRGSMNDTQLDLLRQRQLLDFASFILLGGIFVKRVGNGLGMVRADTYINSGGIFTHNVDAKSNAQGDTDQSVSVYRLKFGNGQRALL